MYIRRYIIVVMWDVLVFSLLKHLWVKCQGVFNFQMGRKERKERRKTGRKAGERKRGNGNVRGGKRERKEQMSKQNDNISMLTIGESK